MIILSPWLTMNKRLIFIFLVLLLAILPGSDIEADDEPKDKVRVVVLDAGHGGEDPGALGKISREKDIVLNITLQVGKYIEENFDDVKVIYTRKNDVFIPLHKRADIANSNKADLFISIHANWASNSRIIGTETFALGDQRSEKNLEVVMKENSVITLEEDYTSHYEGFDPTSAESYIIFSLMQNTYLEQSLSFASYVQDQFRTRVQRTDRGVKQDIFLVLWKTTMPSVLIETGFLTNPTEEKFLMSDQGQTYIASAIYRAFKEYKQDIESRSIFSIDPEIISETDPEGQVDNIYFTVQIASSSRQLKEDHDIFTSFDDVHMLRKDKYYKYAVGHFDEYADALNYSRSVREKLQGAFVIAVKNDKIIPVSEALKK